MGVKAGISRHEHMSTADAAVVPPSRPFDSLQGGAEVAGRGWMGGLWRQA
jgi:hypothetical protein